MLTDMVRDLTEIESDLGSPVFFWGSTEYPCVPSVNEAARTLEEGGFSTDKVLSMTVRLLDVDGNSVFTDNILPQAQETVTYNTENFRIISTHKHPTGAYVRILASNTTRGV